MKKLALGLATVTLLIGGVAVAVPSPKYFVCKYVGTPGTNETLQTGQNPISVSGNALTPPIVIGGSFNDKQGRSYVIAEDTGQPEPTCPVPTNPTPPPVVTPPPTPNPVVNPTPVNNPVPQSSTVVTPDSTASDYSSNFVGK